MNLCVELFVLNIKVNLKYVFKYMVNILEINKLAPLSHWICMQENTDNDFSIDFVICLHAKLIMQKLSFCVGKLLQLVGM